MVLIMAFLVILFGISKAICDISESGFSTSKFRNLNPQFWDKHKSWRNKWKGGVAANGEKFFGSSTFLVWTTDAWHFFNGLSYLSLFCIAVLTVIMTHNIFYIALVFSLSFIFFELIYKYLKK